MYTLMNNPLMNKFKSLNKWHQLVLIFFGVALIFILFSFFIGENKSPYASEIAAAFMGGILTIIITAMLLHKQTEVELEKESNVKIMERKINVYDEILTIIKPVLYEGKIERKQKLKLQLVNLKLVQIASPEVIGEFQKFSEIFKVSCEGDDEITNDELPDLLKALLRVCVEIRKDIAPRDKPKEQAGQITDLLMNAEATIKMFEIKQEIAECNPEESKYFDDIMLFVKNSIGKLSQHPGKVGVSIKKSDNPIVWYYPITSTTPNNLIFHRDNLSEEAKNILKESKNANFNMKRIPLKLADMPVERLKKLLEVA